MKEIISWLQVMFTVSVLLVGGNEHDILDLWPQPFPVSSCLTAG